MIDECFYDSMTKRYIFLWFFETSQLEPALTVRWTIEQRIQDQFASRRMRTCNIYITAFINLLITFLKYLKHFGVFLMVMYAYFS